MCNRYRGAKEYGRLAAQRWEMTEHASNHAWGEVHPKGYGHAITADGLQAMVWGFPRIMKGAKGQPLAPRPVNNTRTENLGSPFWRDSFIKRRCLIPVDRWCEAHGDRGAMKEVWFGLPEADGFMVAGIWRDSAEWGRTYSMVMVPANASMEPVHDRMPVILPEAEHRRWMAAEPEDALKLCLPWPGPLEVDLTDAPYFRRASPGAN